MLFIYQVVTLSRRNISGSSCPDLCSKVLGILNCPAPLTAVPVHPEHHVTGCSETTVVTGEEFCRWVDCQSSLCPEESVVVASDGSVFQWPDTTVRRQFLFALLEDCSFFAHLVLRCVRGGRSPHGVVAPRRVKPRSVSAIQRGTQPVTCSYAQRELQNLPAGATETSFPELETLWTEVACRRMHISVCEGERS